MSAGFSDTRRVRRPAGPRPDRVPRRPGDAPEVERVVDVLDVLVGDLRHVDRALRLAGDLPLAPVDRGDRRLRHRAADVRDHAVHDVPGLQLRERVEGPDAGDEVPPVELEEAGDRGEHLPLPLVRPLARLVLLRGGDRVPGQDHPPLHGAFLLHGGRERTLLLSYTLPRTVGGITRASGVPGASPRGPRGRRPCGTASSAGAGTRTPSGGSPPPRAPRPAAGRTPPSPPCGTCT